MHRSMQWFIAVLIFSCFYSLPSSAATRPPVRLVLWITVDQFRGDFPDRYHDRFGNSGFRFLMDQGTHYTHAHYKHANTLTAVGHATLFTGGHSAQHGMAGNDWFDRQTGEPMYCVQDINHKILGEETSRQDGTSPRNLTSNTVGDQLILENEKSKVFGLSFKDRGAIIPAGHLGKAFWYSKKTGRFITSTYYYPTQPQWLDKWNAKNNANQYINQTWNLSRDESAYHFIDDRVVERPNYGLDNTFPHPLGDTSDAHFYSRLRYTPFADHMLSTFAKEIITREKLGQRDVVDMLAISFSATDYIGHMFGPNSREAEDNALRLDKTLSELFAYVDQTVGLDKTLIILSADHGVCETPEHTQLHGLPAGRLQSKALITEINAILKTKFNCKEDLIQTLKVPNVYLNESAIKICNLNREQVATAAAKALEQSPGITLAITRQEIEQLSPAHNPTLLQLQKAFHKKRSGDILIAQSPHWSLYTGQEAATHGSPQTYDTHVPIFLYGPHIKPGRIARTVAPADIAVTLSLYLGIQAPASATGQPLTEVLDF